MVCTSQNDQTLSSQSCRLHNRAHLDGLLNPFLNRLTDPLIEGFSSLIQQIETAARGFGFVKDHRIRTILLLGEKKFLQSQPKTLPPRA